MDDSLVCVDESFAPVLVVTINRAHVKNAVDRPTARLLHRAFKRFGSDDRFSIAILRGAGATFCAGADLTAAFDELEQVRSAGSASRSNDLFDDMSRPGPMGPTRMTLPKPVIACIEGYALAGGLELACWCDLRVAERSATLGLPCRTRGVPLIDGGTVRLPQLIGRSRAMDLILTGRHISATEAERIGLVNQVVDDGGAFDAALRLAQLIASKPQECMRHDRLSVLDSPLDGEHAGPAAGTLPHANDEDACPFAVQDDLRRQMHVEFRHGLKSLASLGSALEEFVRRPRPAKAHL